MTDPTKYTFSDQGFVKADLNDVFVRKEVFLDGGLWGWGTNICGTASGYVSGNFTASPSQTISGGMNWKIPVTRGGTSAAIKSDGTLWIWGGNSCGVFGTNAATASGSSPVQTVSSGTNWKDIGLGDLWVHAAAIKTDGTLWSWGSTSNGILGNNLYINALNYSSPIQTVSGGTNWKSLSVGSIFSSAIKTDGTLWLWGRGYAGQLGNNAATPRSSPVQTVSSGTNWKSVNAGSSKASAIKTDGTLWVWGSYTDGQLGDNTTISKSSPVQTITGGTNWSKLNSGHGVATAGIKSDGTLWLWGRNTAGQLGDNSTVHKSSPVQTVSSGASWKLISMSFRHSVGIKHDGTLWSWGCASHYALGNDLGFNQSSPVQTLSGGTNWRLATAGHRDSPSPGGGTTLAIKEGEW